MTKIIERNSKGYYTIDNKKYLSVTKHFDLLFGVPAGVVQYYYCKYGWEGALKKRNESAEYGTEIHKLLSDHLCNCDGWGEPDERIAKRFMEISSQLQEKKIEVHYVEKKAWSKKLKAAGTIDFIGVKENKNPQLIIGDWKTGSEDLSKELMQIAAYAYMVIENQDEYSLPFKVTPKNIGGFVAHVGKDDSKKPKFYWFSAAELKQGLTAFKHVQALLKYQGKI